MGHYYDIRPDRPVPGLPNSIKAKHWDKAAMEVIRHHPHGEAVTYEITGESDMPAVAITIVPLKPSGVWGWRK